MVVRREHLGQRLADTGPRTALRIDATQLAVLRDQGSGVARQRHVLDAALGTRPQVDHFPTSARWSAGRNPFFGCRLVHCAFSVIGRVPPTAWVAGISRPTGDSGQPPSLRLGNAVLDKLDPFVDYVGGVFGCADRTQRALKTNAASRTSSVVYWHVAT